MKLRTFLLLFVCALLLSFAAVRTDSPKAASTVTIRLDGLMALAMGDSLRASLGLLDVHHNTPDLLISKKINSRSFEIAHLRGEEMRGVISISVEG